MNEVVFHNFLRVQRASDSHKVDVMATIQTSRTMTVRAPQTQNAFLNVFMIVGADDTPLLFMDLSSEGLRDDSPHLDEFIIHSSLDAIDAVLVCDALIFPHNRAL